MRLIAGEAKGRRLHVPRGLRVRPSGARFRESAFGILEHRDAISDARVLDLFAGSGALGLEALSRGAAHLVCVEKDPAVARVLSSNVAHCGFGPRVEIRTEPVERALGHLSGRAPAFDLVFLDPPYDCGLAAGIPHTLIERGLLASGAWVLVEHARREELRVPAGCVLEVERRFGESHLTLLQRAVSAA